MAQIIEGLSHDSVNRFLLRERYSPKDLFNELKPHINLIGGTLSGDDTVIEKPYSTLTTELIGYFWSGLKHRPVKGINLIIAFLKWLWYYQSGTFYRTMKAYSIDLRQKIIDTYHTVPISQRRLALAEVSP